MSKQRKESIKSGARVFNDGHPCKNGHFPAIRLTSTGQCIACNKQEAQDRLMDKRSDNTEWIEKQEHKSRLQEIRETTKCYFWFTYLDGSKQLFGPYKTAKGSAIALCNLWLKTYGYPHPDVNPKDYDYSSLV